MAYIVSTTQTAASAAATSYTVTLGAHVSGDLLLVCLSQDNGATAFAPDATSTTAGWVMLGTGAQSGVCRGQWAYLIADSASEVNPVFTSGATSAVWIGTCLVIRDAHATAPFGATPTSGVNFIRTDWNNVSSSAAGTLTPPEDECLLIYSWNADGSNQYMRCKLNEVTAVDKYNTTSITHIIGHRQQQTAASTAGSATMYTINATEGGNGWVLAIRNKSGVALQPDLRPSITELKWHGSWETPHDGITWQAPSSFAASINSITCSTTAPTAALVAATAQAPWGGVTGLSATESTSPCWAGGTFTISSTDMTGLVFGIQLGFGAGSTSSVFAADGLIIGFSDGTNWVTYQARTKSFGWATATDYSAFIALGNATEYANSDGDSSSSINWGAVTRIGYFIHRATTPAVSFFVKNVALFNSTALTGGGSSRPSTFNDYQTAINSWGGWQWADLQGSAQIKAKTSVQIGDGTNKTYFDGATNAFCYPQAWSATTNSNWQMDWNVAAGRVTLGVRAGANDTIKLAAGAATTANAQLLTIASDSYAGDIYDFAQAFGGFSVTWDTDVPCSGATFTGGGQVSGKGGDFTNCIFKNSTAGTTAAVVGFDANGGSMTGCTTTATSSNGYHIELGTSVTAFTLANHTFSGSALTDKVHVLATTGTVTITISGTTSLVAEDVTSAGATVVISAPVLYQSVVVSGFTAGSRIQIYDTTNSVELFNGTASAGDTVVSGTTATWTDPTAAAGTRAIRVRVAYVSGVTAKQFIETSGLTCGVTSGTESVTYPITQVADTTYDANGINGPAIYAGSGVTFTDAATDLVNINVGVAGTVSLQTVYACFVYWIFTAAGIDDDVAYIDAPDPANYILTSMKFRNTSATPLKITGGYFYDSTGSVENCVDDAGSTGNIYPMPAHVVAYATGSGALTAGDITNIWSAATRTITTTIPTASDVAAQVLTSAQSTPIYADARKMNGATITGTGTSNDLWRGA